MKKIWLFVGMASTWAIGMEKGRLENPRALMQSTWAEYHRMESTKRVNDKTMDAVTRGRIVLKSLVTITTNIELLEQNREVYGDTMVKENEIKVLKDHIAPYMRKLAYWQS